MRPIVRIALSAASVLVVSRMAERLLPPEAAAASPARADSAGRAPCPAGTLPDWGACIPVPTDLDGEDGPSATVEENAHHDRGGRLVRYEHIPRRPERPADYRSYVLPIPTPTDRAFIGSGYDLDRPDAEQRRGSHLKAVGHGGLDLAAPRGTPVHALRLEHQTGETEVLFVGELFGTTVVTHHVVAEAGTTRDYLIVHGHLERAATGLRSGMAAQAGTTLGFVGDTGSAGVVHLHFEVRRARDGVRVRELSPGELVQNARTIACDPRNVLELAIGQNSTASH